MENILKEINEEIAKIDQLLTYDVQNYNGVVKHQRKAVKITLIWVKSLIEAEQFRDLLDKEN